MKYVNYDTSTGDIKGFYDTVINTDIPDTAKKITDDVWLILINNQGKYIVDTTKILPDVITSIEQIFTEVPTVAQIEPVDEEKAAMAEAIIDLETRLSEMEAKVNA